MRRYLGMKKIYLFICIIFTLFILGKAQNKVDLSRIDSLIQIGEYHNASHLIKEYRLFKNKKNQDNLSLLDIDLSLAMGNPMNALEISQTFSPTFLKRNNVNLLLAKLYYLNYNFLQSQEYLEKTIQKRRQKQVNQINIPLMKERVTLAERMLENCQYVEVLDSCQISSLKDVQIVAGLSKEVGVYSFGEVFDKFTYSSSLGFDILSTKKDKEGKSHIFYQRKTFTGEVLEERFLDELFLPTGEYFPLLRQDGQTIIFATPSVEINKVIETENSSFNPIDALGGFDLYTSRRNPITGRFQPPTLLGMPFNSPFDDILLIYDDLYKVGLLVSSRYAPKGFYNCYRFRIPDTIQPLPTNDLELKKNFAKLLPWQITKTRK